MKAKLILILGVLFSVSLFGQDLPSDKRIEKARVKQIKVDKSDFSTGKEIKMTELFTKYDATGQILEYKEFDKEGKFVKHETYQYDGEGNKIKETEFDVKGKILKTIAYKYNSNRLCTESTVFFPNGKVKSKRVYTYEYYSE